MADVNLEIEAATAAHAEILASTDSTEAIARAFSGVSDLLVSILLELRLMQEANDSLE